VGLFSGGPADLQGGPIFFSNTEKQEKKQEKGGSTFAGGPALRAPPPDATGLLRTPPNVSNTVRFQYTSDK